MSSLKSKTPLLIGQGSKDRNLIASGAIFAALKRLGEDVEYRIYKDEGHVLEGRPNVIDFLAATAGILGRTPEPSSR